MLIDLIVVHRLRIKLTVRLLTLRLLTLRFAVVWKFRSFCNTRAYNVNISQQIKQSRARSVGGAAAHARKAGILGGKCERVSMAACLPNPANRVLVSGLPTLDFGQTTFTLVY